MNIPASLSSPSHLQEADPMAERNLTPAVHSPAQAIMPKYCASYDQPASCEKFHEIISSWLQPCLEILWGLYQTGKNKKK